MRHLINPEVFKHGLCVFATGSCDFQNYLSGPVSGPLLKGSRGCETDTMFECILKFPSVQ